MILFPSEGLKAYSPWPRRGRQDQTHVALKLGVCTLPGRFDSITKLLLCTPSSAKWTELTSCGWNACGGQPGKTSCWGLGVNEILKEERRLLLSVGNESSRGWIMG